MVMTEKFATYLERRGLPKETVDALKSGDPLSVTGDIFASWVVAAFKEGQRHERRKIAEAIAPKLDALETQAPKEGQ